MTGIKIILGVATKESTFYTHLLLSEWTILLKMWKRICGCVHLLVVSSLPQASELQQKIPRSTLICYFQSETFSSRWEREFVGCVHLLVVLSLLKVLGQLKWNCVPWEKDFRRVMTGIKIILAIATFPTFSVLLHWMKTFTLHCVLTENEKIVWRPKKKSYAYVLCNKYVCCKKYLCCTWYFKNLFS